MEDVKLWSIQKFFFCAGIIIILVDVIIVSANGWVYRSPPLQRNCVAFNVFLSVSGMFFCTFSVSGMIFCFRHVFLHLFCFRYSFQVLFLYIVSFRYIHCMYCFVNCFVIVCECITPAKNFFILFECIIIILQLLYVLLIFFQLSGKFFFTMYDSYHSPEESR